MSISERSSPVHALPLHVSEYGARRADRPSVLLLHGLLGSSINWARVVRALQAHVHCLVADLRNHGRSPHHGEMGYEVMVADVLALMDRYEIESLIPVGHSMGGKVAMCMALSAPQRVQKMVVVDIAPVHYQHRFEVIFRALNALDLQSIKSRQDADTQLAAYLPSLGLRQFLLQNLLRVDGRWGWRMNLPVLQASMANLQAFAEPAAGAVFNDPVLFVQGADSDYIKEEYKPLIHRWFTQARFTRIEDATHWVYADQPEAFTDVLTAFLTP